MSEVLKCFPFKTFRKHQQETIEKVQKHFESEKEYVILESPTGSGKSGIAVCLSLFNGNSFLLTSQKVLQDQYWNDFSNKGLHLLKGKSNYSCVNFGNCDCAEGCLRITKKCPMRDMCIYELEKKKAMNSKILLTNYSYYLHVMEYARFLQPRALTIFDESHNLEQHVFSIVEFSFSSYWLSKLGVVSKIPEYQTVQEYVYWVQELLSKIETLKIQTESQINFIKDSSSIDLVLLANLKKEMEALESQSNKINKFLKTYESTEWIFDLTDSKVGNKITFKPLTIASFTKDLLFSMSEKKLLMSATIGGKKNLCKTLGINEDECEYISVPSSFSNDRRPIFLTKSGNMSHSKIESTLPKVAEDINTILEHHSNEKGLIHSQSYKIQNYIKENVAEVFKNRIITHDSTDRTSSLAEFIKSNKPKVLVTPSMTDGIDLKDDLARFIVIVKIPYLFLGDKQIKRRMEIDPEWYRWKAALTLVQAAGRAMRHDNDHCTIYIMDSGIKWFIKQNRDYFPEYFIDSIQN